MGFKAKKCGVPPTHPALPMVEQILEDCAGAPARDLVFTALAPEDPPGDPRRSEDPEAQRERLYQQSRAYKATNARLQQAGEGLRQLSQGLQQAGAQLELDVGHVTRSVQPGASAATSSG